MYLCVMQALNRNIEFNNPPLYHIRNLKVLHSAASDITVDMLMAASDITIDMLMPNNL